MEIKITHLLNKDLMDYSASVAEIGEDAGSITWENALDSGLSFFSTDEQKQDARDYIKEFGAWPSEEIEAWSDQELNALVLQMIAGNLREYLRAKEGPDFERWKENNGGSIYESGKDLYFYLGH